jgi:hypothetical protein
LRSRHAVTTWDRSFSSGIGLRSPCHADLTLDTDRVQSIAAALPAVMWPKWSERLLPDLRCTAVARTTLSCATLLAGSEVKTVAAANLLGERIAPNALNHRLWVLRTSAYWQSICAALIRLSDYLDGVGAPIDYQRRRNLDYSELLTEDSWRQICTQAGDPLREPRTAVGAQCYLIEKLSGSPALRLTVQTPHSTSIRPPCSPRHAPTADSTTRSPSAELRLARNRAVVEVPAPLPLPQPIAVSDRTYVVKILESHPGLSGIGAILKTVRDSVFGGVSKPHRRRRFYWSPW